MKYPGPPPPPPNRQETKESKQIHANYQKQMEEWRKNFNEWCIEKKKEKSIIPKEKKTDLSRKTERKYGFFEV